MDLGDLPAGEEPTVTFRGVADLSRSPAGLAAAPAQVYAAGFGPERSGLEWLVAAHRVDRGAPEKLGVDVGSIWVGPKGGLLSGDAFDESGIAQITLELTGPKGGVATVNCPVGEHEAGRWTCQWDVAAANGGTLPPDGAEITIRCPATDRHGNVSPWSKPHTVRYDGKPPALTLPPRLNTVQRGGLRLRGRIVDAAGLAAFSLCVDGKCTKPGLVSRDGRESRWDFATEIGASDFQTHTVTLQAGDVVGNRMAEPLAFPIVVDNVAPRPTADQVRRGRYAGQHADGFARHGDRWRADGPHVGAGGGAPANSSFARCEPRAAPGRSTWRASAPAGTSSGWSRRTWWATGRPRARTRWM